MASKFASLLRRRPSTAMHYSPPHLRHPLISSSPNLPIHVHGGHSSGTSFLHVKAGPAHIGHFFSGAYAARSSSAGLVPGCERIKSAPFWNVGARFLCSAPEKGQLKMPGKAEAEGTRSSWSFLRRWVVPWGCPTVVITMSACSLMSCLVLAVIPMQSVQKLLSLWLENDLDIEAGVLFLDTLIISIAILGVIFGITGIFKPFPDKIFFYKFKDLLSLKEGWLFWTIIGVLSHLIACAIRGVIYSLSDLSTSKWVSAKDIISPYIGASIISTTFVLGKSSVIAPIVEEVLFRGFLMVSLTKWLPTPLSILWSAAVFAVSHPDPEGFPHYFVIGTILGFFYAQTRNLVVPICIHSAINSIAILLILRRRRQADDNEQVAGCEMSD